MKRNALIRIIIWSLLIVVLCSIMVSVIAKQSNQPKSLIFNLEVPSETISQDLQNSSDPVGTVIKSMSVYSGPDSDGFMEIGVLDVGTSVTIRRQTLVDKENWYFITFPYDGWVLAEFISVPENFIIPDAPIDSPSRTESPLSSTEQISTGGDRYIYSPAKISELEIEWVTGKILIQPTDTDQITIKEDGVSDPKYAMVLRKRDDTLKIQFCEDNIDGIGITFNTPNITKDLTILVPKDWTLDSLEIDCASATVEVNDMTIREVDFDGASGACEFENCTVEEMDIDTASGDIKFVGSLGMLDCDAASASVYAVLANTPRRLDLDSMSGDLEILLPNDAGFTLSLSAMRSDFTSDFETTLKNGNYVCGDGSCRINVDALSGDVIIRKDAAAN